MPSDVSCHRLITVVSTPLTEKLVVEMLIITILEMMVVRS